MRLAIAPLLAGCGSGGTGEATATDRCEEVENVPLQGGAHLIGDQRPPVDYNSTPPTSGWHSSAPLDVEVYDTERPLSEAEQVTVLEAGAVVVTYGDLADDERTRLERHVRENYSERVAVTPYDELDSGEVAFTAEGKLQRCSGLDFAALDEFIDSYAAESPARPGED